MYFQQAFMEIRADGTRGKGKFRTYFMHLFFADESQLPLNKLFVVLLSKNTQLAYDTFIPTL